MFFHLHLPDVYTRNNHEEAGPGKKTGHHRWFVKGNNTSLQKSRKLFRLCWLPLTRIVLRGLNCCRSLKIDSPGWKPFQQLRNLAKTLQHEEHISAFRLTPGCSLSGKEDILRVISSLCSLITKVCNCRRSLPSVRPSKSMNWTPHLTAKFWVLATHLVGTWNID